MLILRAAGAWTPSPWAAAASKLEAQASAMASSLAKSSAKACMPLASAFARRVLSRTFAAESWLVMRGAVVVPAALPPPAPPRLPPGAAFALALALPRAALCSSSMDRSELEAGAEGAAVWAAHSAAPVLSWPAGTTGNSAPIADPRLILTARDHCTLQHACMSSSPGGCGSKVAVICMLVLSLTTLLRSTLGSQTTNSPGRPWRARRRTIDLQVMA